MRLSDTLGGEQGECLRRRSAGGDLDSVLSTTPARTPECRPSPGGVGSCDAIAHALGDKEVRTGANMVAIAVPGRVLPCPRGVEAALTLAPVVEEEEEEDRYTMSKQSEEKEEEESDATVGLSAKGGGSRDVVLHCGIIDILQEYNYSKSIETTVKGAAYGRDVISSVDPVSYSRRFQRFLRKVFE